MSGFTPMAALQSIAVVNGMPTIYGDGMLALVRASGLLEDIIETIVRISILAGFPTIVEFALMADGVAPDKVYETLGTPEGVDRAFKKLDTIKKDVIWWEAGAQPPQLLADGEVSMAFAFNGRIFNAAQGEGKPFKIVWDGQIYEMEGWVIPKGAPDLDAAKEFIAFSTAPEQQARAAEFISYGPPRVSAAALVGNIEGTDVPMGPNLPTFADNMKQALGSNQEFWVDHDAELAERFNAWLAAK